ncbi:desulfoferrodoxin [Candidatus Beckwithbacteria bacterium]|nr:desulfoferrodoxin [Candidatus Beckwithbacteria bacterium]
MAKRHQIFRCNVCGHIIEVLQEGSGTLVCCNQPMELLEPKTQDQGQEKHVPVVEKTANGIKVKVGEIEHPMEKDHFIQWIQLIADGVCYRKFLHPGEKPEAEFEVQAQEMTVREYCNLHGLWQK